MKHIRTILESVVNGDTGKTDKLTLSELFEHSWSESELDALLENALQGIPTGVIKRIVQSYAFKGGENSEIVASNNNTSAKSHIYKYLQDNGERGHTLVKIAGEIEYLISPNREANTGFSGFSNTSAMDYSVFIKNGTRIDPPGSRYEWSRSSVAKLIIDRVDSIGGFKAVKVELSTVGKDDKRLEKAAERKAQREVDDNSEKTFGGIASRAAGRLAQKYIGDKVDPTLDRTLNKLSDDLAGYIKSGSYDHALTTAEDIAKKLRNYPGLLNKSRTVGDMKYFAKDYRTDVHKGFSGSYGRSRLVDTVRRLKESFSEDELNAIFESLKDDETIW